MNESAIITQNNANSVRGKPFQPGNPGKQAGTVGKLNKTVKETVLAVFNDLQTDPKTSLKSFAIKYPRDFHNIAARLIPTELTGSLKHIINVTETDDDTDQIQDAEVIPE